MEHFGLNWRAAIDIVICMAQGGFLRVPVEVPWLLSFQNLDYNIPFRLIARLRNCVVCCALSSCRCPTWSGLSVDILLKRSLAAKESVKNHIWFQPTISCWRPVCFSLNVPLQQLIGLPNRYLKTSCRKDTARIQSPSGNVEWGFQESGHFGFFCLGPQDGQKLWPALRRRWK